jgi:uncharacterized protein YecE (DUF72 family)
MKISWNTGCSGFHYKEWKDTFYEGIPAGKWFSFYSKHFNTLESNVTFYRLPALSTLLKWHDDSPEHFSFSVKAPQLITHYKKFVDIENELSAFYELIKKGFKEKLACVLFQFPPSFSYTEERLETIISNLNNSFNNVVEFRHESWFRIEVYEKLQQHKIIFCNISHPKLKDVFIKTAPVIYFRFHGVPELFKSSYSKEYLKNILYQINQDKKVKKVYLYFNNTMTGAAIDNAGFIKELTLKLNF